MGEDTKRLDRRRFLKGAVLAGLGAALAGCAPAAPPAPTAAPAKPAAEPTKAPAAAASTAPPAPAKLNWPEKNKTMKIIVPWAPGNSADRSSRLLAEFYKADLGINVEVVNMEGAGGQVGTTEFVKAKPDGYTLFANSIPTTSLIYLDPERNATYNRQSFAPIAVYAVDPNSFACRAEAPWKTMKDLIDDARANPGKITVGTNGYMNPTHLAVANLMKEAGVKFALAHFDGTSNLTSLLGGHVDVSCTGPTVMMQYIRKGELRLLGVTTEEPSDRYPAPTLRQQGYNVLSFITRGHAAPGGTPKEIIDRLAGIIRKATQDEKFLASMEANNNAVTFWGAEKYAEDWDRQDKEAKAAIEEAKATKTSK